MATTHRLSRIVASITLTLLAAQATWGVDKASVVQAAANTRGLVVHLGCGNGQSTAQIGKGKPTIVHAIDASPANVSAARKLLMQQGLYGKVTVARLVGDQLPYVDNLVNLLVAEDPGNISADEITRVLCPNGVAWVNRGGNWSKIVKPRPAEIDDWGHYLHDPSNNAVGKDTVVGPPRRMQWVGGPRYSRHHDRMSSFNAMVTVGGRVFYIFDEATPISILVPPKWKLIARDAFNGTILWKRDIGPWHPHLFKLKSGPADLPRRLVATKTRVFVTLGIDKPVVALDAVTGETIRTYEETKGAEEILHDNGVLYLRVNPTAGPREIKGLRSMKLTHDLGPRRAMAVDVATGKVLWSMDTPLLPGTLTLGKTSVFLHDGRNFICLDRSSGKRRWSTEQVKGKGVSQLNTYFMPTVVAYDDVVLVSGLPMQGGPAKARKGKKKGKGGPKEKAFICGFSAETGKLLWRVPRPNSGYKSAQDLFVINGLAWTGDTSAGQGDGTIIGLDLHTGEVKVSFTPDVKTFWFHHRCHRGKATGKYLLTSRTGIEFVDVEKKSWSINHWVRGACLYGIMPANGLIYAPQHPCACYLETKLYGLNALAPAKPGRIPTNLPPRLERGPAYDAMANASGPASPPLSWPTFRADTSRSGKATTTVSPKVSRQWACKLTGKLTAPTISNNKAFVASIDTHTVYAIDMTTGNQAWSYTVGGKVDSPPTIDHGRVLFGSADGYVYCLRAKDGALAWRFRAAPMDQRTMAFEQLESVWPVHGSVLVRNNEVWAVAGRSMFLDSGLRLWRLDAATGTVLSSTVLDNKEQGTGKDLHDYVSWLSMPVALPDVLSSDGEHVYMRSQPFGLDGKRAPLEKFARNGEGGGGRNFAAPAVQNEKYLHLFAPTGFLDDTYWHRTYWMYGSRFYSGWCGYFTAGKVAPAGKILVFDDKKVYGYGRELKYFKWTTPIECQLFATSKAFTKNMKEGKPSPRTGWSQKLPLMARALVLTNDLLFAAGPPDLVDESQAQKTFAQPQMKAKLATYAKALTGGEGALLWAVSKNDGKKLAEYKLEFPPVFNGMAAANKKLVIVTTDGSVLCYGQ